jgi:hypothetical protein
VPAVVLPWAMEAYGRQDQIRGSPASTYFRVNRFGWHSPLCLPCFGKNRAQSHPGDLAHCGSQIPVQLDTKMGRIWF